ncbi:hypothetical protein RCO48_20685 [Peribacillus frigoritolerans]|nr:hypothetical protein [Peribacillus frigoritolerans]
MIAAWVIMLFYPLTFAADLHGLAKVDKKKRAGRSSRYKKPCRSLQ